MEVEVKTHICNDKNKKEKKFPIQNQVLLNNVIHGINESMFQNVNKLHITFGTLSLMDNEDRILATELFQEGREIVDKVRYCLVKTNFRKVYFCHRIYILLESCPLFA